MERERYTPADMAEVLDSPEWTEDEIRRAKRGRDVLPAGFLAKRRGRPPSEDTKEAISIRLDRDVVAAFKADGEGWQRRMNEALRKAAKLPAKAQ
jgi:uncharacterized protein (DUF4415 family)